MITTGTPGTISTAFTTDASTKIFTRVVYNVVLNAGTAAAPKIPAGPLTTIFRTVGCGLQGHHHHRELGLPVPGRPVRIPDLRMITG